jgi:malate/lactate dehydrogenase
LLDVVLGLPSLVSSEGVQVLDNYPLNHLELEKLHHSAAIVKNAIAQVTRTAVAVS